MMKKILILLSLFLVFTSVIYAEINIDIVPYSAYSGIPVGTDYFKGTGKTVSGSGSWPWTWKNLKYGSSQDASYLDPEYADYYTDLEMIGCIAIQNYTGSRSFSKFDFKGPVTITVSTPNGMYLESQSDPTFRRPIEIWLYPAYLTSTSSSSQVKLTGKEYFKQITNDSPTVTILDNVTKNGIYEVWFDLVLVLPGKLDASTNEVVVDGVRYKLKDADDYSCLVTITVEYDGKTGSMTIPFTGYYDSSKTIQTVKDSTVSMNVVLNNKASNLNIDTDRGKQVDIGQVSFVGNKDTSAVLFFSSSYDAFSQGDTFKMKLDTLGVNDDLTSLNSIGFTITVKDGSGKNDITYDGTTYTQSSWTSLSNFTSANKTKLEYIIPEESDGVVILSYGSNSNSWKKYDSQIILELENNDFTMISGRYEGEIYVHVLTM